MESLRSLIPAQSDSVVLTDNSLTGADWLAAGGIFVAAIVVAILASRLLRRVITHGIGHGFAAILTARLIGYAIFLIGLSYALTTLGVRVGPLLGALGLGGLVLALALQPVVENFVASVILQARRPFTVGDTVDLAGTIGTVVDVDSRTTHLRGLDGTHIRVPNSSVVGEPIVNLTREPMRRSSLQVGVAYDTDLQRAAKTLGEALQRVPRVLKNPPPSINLDGFGDSSIGFTVLYWHRSDVPSELATRHDVVIAIHQALAHDGITIAFPQMVVWSGHEDDSDTYDRRLDRVHTPHPGLDEEPGTRRRRPQWRRSRSGTNNGDSD
jgi:small-conductance mechanosensitive channel